MKEYKYKINGNAFNVTIGDTEDNMVHVEVNGTPYKVELEKPVAAPKRTIARPAATAARTTAQPTAAPAPARPAASAGGTGRGRVKSPLPGVILNIHVAVGDTVKKGQLVITLEAMKMENNINADRDGKVTAINVNKGDSVLEGADLIIIE